MLVLILGHAATPRSIFSKSKSFPRQMVTLSTATVQLSLPQISATDDNKLLLVSLIIIINWQFLIGWNTETITRGRDKTRESSILDEELHTTTHSRLTALCPGLPRWAGTRKVKPTWIVLKQEIASGSSISWAIRKSALRSRQNHASTPPLKFFTGRMPFLLPNKQRQSTAG